MLERPFYSYQDSHHVHGMSGLSLVPMQALMLGWRRECLVHTVHACAKFPWWYYSATLKLTESLVHLLKGHTAELYAACETHLDSFEVRNNIALMVTVCIALFEVISKLQKKRLHQSHAVAFSWDGWMHG